VLAVAAIAGALLYARGRRHARTTWRESADRVVTEGSLVAVELTSGVRGDGDHEPALQRRLQAFDAALASLQASAPSDEHEHVVIGVRGVVDRLGADLASDIRLRIGPPAPTPGQLDTSRAVVVQSAHDLDAALGRLAQGAATTSS
jgi:hypothetical protein